MNTEFHHDSYISLNVIYEQHLHTARKKREGLREQEEGSWKTYYRRN